MLILLTILFSPSLADIRNHSVFDFLYISSLYFKVVWLYFFSEGLDSINGLRVDVAAVETNIVSSILNCFFFLKTTYSIVEIEINEHFIKKKKIQL